MADLLSTGRVAKTLGVSPACVVRLANKGRIASQRHKRSLKFKQDDVLEFIRKNPRTQTHDSESRRSYERTQDNDFATARN